MRSKNKTPPTATSVPISKLTSPPPPTAGVTGEAPTAPVTSTTPTNTAKAAAAPASSKGKKKKRRTPFDTKFKQQTLPSCEPVFKEVFPAFFIVGLLLTPLGAAYFIVSTNIHEVRIDYTNCKPIPSTGGVSSHETCAEEIDAAWAAASNSSTWTLAPPPCQCELPLQLDADFEGEVLVYYELTNFYQNHRHYVQSRDDVQLTGGSKKPQNEKKSACAPFDKRKSGESVRWVWPCGAIANSMFQDDIQLINATTGSKIKMSETGIAWNSDKKSKFKNPTDWTTAAGSNSSNTVSAAFNQSSSGEFIKPSAWVKEVFSFDLDPQHLDNNGVQNEDFIVWMRTAALPNFKKLYRKIEGGLPKGNYTLQIKYSFRVKEFNGTKAIILSTTSIFGGKNPFLGICSMVVGAICLLLGVFFFMLHIKQ